MSVHRFLSFVFILLIASAIPITAETCQPEFPFKNGWLGSDAAYSIPLNDGRSVWIFGDTLYGDKRIVVENEPRMVRNAIGISTCKGGKWDIEYVMRKNSSGQLIDFFQAKSPYWYWALDGFVKGEQLWVTLLCLRSVPNSGSFTLGFATCGTDLARVTGLEQDPQKWEVKIYPLVSDGVHAYPSATAVVDGDFVYIFALYEKGSRPMVLSRIPLSGLDKDPKASMQYLAKDGTWRAGFEPAKARHVMDKGNTEMTVRYHQGRKQWLAVMNDPQLETGNILLRTAPKLTGPWSDGQVIYTIPEMQKSHPSWDKDNFCYAGKEHPELREGNTILITYACNTRAVKKLETMPHIYFPKVVRLELPK
ncbi:MAG TPA: DUF4185 domain-containing protein [Terriglobales bacterium]|nr:DUF4185 domain-containing protein [Terriglobales bacterium]